MRIRHKPHARPALEACPFFVGDPRAVRGRWHSLYATARPLHLELGCGRGEFIAAMAARNPQVNYLAADLKDEVLYDAVRAVSARTETPENLLFTAFDAERIGEVLAPGDSVARLYLNFPNPWPKQRDRKHRLTHPCQLARYLAFLAPDGEICLRTDDRALFEDALRDFFGAGLGVVYATRDLLSGPCAGYPASEHQRMFAAMGLPLCFAVARRGVPDGGRGLCHAAR